MADDPYANAFLLAAQDWVCDGYSLDLRYSAQTSLSGTRIWDATVTLRPLPHVADHGTRLDALGYFFGQYQAAVLPKEALLELVAEAVRGHIKVPNGPELSLPTDRPDYHSEMVTQDRWYSGLHLQVIAPPQPTPPAFELAQVANALRTSCPPFDGLTDLMSWLGLKEPGATPSININIGPPVDLLTDISTLASGTLRLTLHAHPNFDVNRISLAVRGMPGEALTTRRQVADKIAWSQSNDRRVGTLTVEVANSVNVLVVLMIGASFVRRHWILDSAKSQNLRLLAMQHFDTDLRKVKQALFESNDSAKFESAVAAVLYLLGFNPAIQPETDAPDLVVTTPHGKLALVECTIRISDFHSKLGKLVDRRGALAKSLAANGQPLEVHAVLVCRLPRDQLAAQENEIQANNLILVTGGRPHPFDPPIQIYP